MFILSILAPLYLAVAAQNNGALAWQRSSDSTNRIFFAPKGTDSYDVALTCAPQSGEIELHYPLHIRGPDQVAKGIDGLLNDTVGVALRSDYVTRYHRARNIQNSPNNNLDGLYINLQTSDDLWRRFYASGNLTIGGSDFGTNSPSEQDIIRNFTNECKTDSIHHGYFAPEIQPTSPGHELKRYLSRHYLQALASLAISISTCVYMTRRRDDTHVYAMVVSVISVFLISLTDAGAYSHNALQNWNSLIRDFALPVFSFFGFLISVWATSSLFYVLSAVLIRLMKRTNAD